MNGVGKQATHIQSSSLTRIFYLQDREAHVEHVACKILLGQVDHAIYILDTIEGSGKEVDSRWGLRLFDCLMSGYEPIWSMLKGKVEA